MKAWEENLRKKLYKYQCFPMENIIDDIKNWSNLFLKFLEKHNSGSVQSLYRNAKGEIKDNSSGKAGIIIYQIQIKINFTSQRELIHKTKPFICTIDIKNTKDDALLFNLSSTKEFFLKENIEEDQSDFNNYEYVKDVIPFSDEAFSEDKFIEILSNRFFDYALNENIRTSSLK